MDQATHDAALAVMRALVEEIKAAAHDPAVVHLVADKLKNGIDMLEKAMTQSGGDQPKKA